MATTTHSSSISKRSNKYSQQLPLLLYMLLAVAAFNALAAVHCAAAKHLDGHHSNHQYHQQQPRQRRLQRESTNALMNARAQCEALRSNFESLDIKLDGIYEEKGAICGGNCCTNATEMILRQRASDDFERVLHDHTMSLHAKLINTANSFQNHMLELTEQSENKTLNVFSQVYRRMVPLSKKLIHHLYGEIISYLKNTHGVGNSIASGASNMNSLEEAVHKFFVNLFPVAYHQAVHLNNDNNGDLHADYINCLKHTYDDLQPFGSIPKEIKHNLVQSVQTAQVFMASMLQSAEVLNEMDGMYSMYLTATCQKHLLKRRFCPSCNGLQRGQVKTCHSYCVNVLRGCTAQYASVLDSPWSNVVDAMDHLVHAHIRSESGIVTTIKQLDGKLSEAIMHAMGNGPDLEMKVKKTCGTPKLLQSLPNEIEVRPAMQQTKWATPVDTDIGIFLSTLDKSKEFYANIVNTVCKDDDVQRKDHYCWTGERISDYTQPVMTQGSDTQRYNPEVPLEPNGQSPKLNELVDKLIKIRKNIGNAIPPKARANSDIQNDMAGHDEEGSGGHIVPIGDDEEYYGSGDGSGDGDSTPYSPITPTEGPPAQDRSSSASSFSLIAGRLWWTLPAALLTLTLVTELATTKSRSSASL